MTTRKALSVLALNAGLGAILMSSSVTAAPPGAQTTDMGLNVSVTTDPAFGGVLNDGGVYTNGKDNVEAVLLANTYGNFIFDLNKTGHDGHRRLVIMFPGSAAET